MLAGVVRFDLLCLEGFGAYLEVGTLLHFSFFAAFFFDYAVAMAVARHSARGSRLQHALVGCTVAPGHL